MFGFIAQSTKITHLVIYAKHVNKQKSVSHLASVAGSVDQPVVIFSSGCWPHSKMPGCS